MGTPIWCPAPIVRRAVDDGVLLVGDAAGLAYPQSGEGIRPAVQSGLFAARTIVEAAGRYTRERLQGYDTWMRSVFGAGAPVLRAMSQLVPAGGLDAAGAPAAGQPGVRAARRAESRVPAAVTRPRVDA